MVTVGVVWIVVEPALTSVTVQVNTCEAPAAKLTGNVVGAVKVKLKAAPLSPSDATIPA